MNKILIILASLFPFHSISQNVDFDKKTKLVLVDGNPSFKIEKTDCGFGMVECHFDIFDSTGKKQIRINFREFNSPVEVSQSNPKGNVTYFEYIFLESRQKAEVNFYNLKELKLAKDIVKNGLMKNGMLNKDAVDEFVLVHGTPFSARVKF